jgi:hypothetical protein
VIMKWFSPVGNQMICAGRAINMIEPVIGGYSSVRFEPWVY